MKGSRRAVPAAVRTALTVSACAMAGLAALSAAMSMRIARQLVTPVDRVADIDILEVDTAAQTITLSRTPDTALPGRYGLFTTGSESYLKLGSVLASDDRTVKRKLLTEIDNETRIAPRAAFSSWYFDAPEQLHVKFESIQITTSVGRCPAWLFPASGDADTWVVHVHGRGTTRAECLRAVPLFHALGMTSLVVSYRNDGEAPSSRAGTYALGLTEWRDVDAAVSEALGRGAKRVVVMGWSMGGAIALQLALNSAHRESIAALVLESPVVEWRAVLDYQARMLRVPQPVAGLAMGALDRGWARPITGADTPLRFDRLDLVARASELRHPILILHSDDDGFVPAAGSYDLVSARPDLVELISFDVARHTKLWNYDASRWTEAIVAWLRRQDLADEAEHDAV